MIKAADICEIKEGERSSSSRTVTIRSMMKRVTKYGLMRKAMRLKLMSMAIRIGMINWETQLPKMMILKKTKIKMVVGN